MLPLSLEMMNNEISAYRLRIFSVTLAETGA
jgi:hypothetical protein